MASEYKEALSRPLSLPSSVAQKQLALNRNFVQNGAAAGAASLILSVLSHILGCSKEFGQRLPSNIGLLLRKL